MQRSGVIDFIRGLSILFVILIHCNIHLPIDKSFLSITGIKLLLCSGYYGVMMFFVVSGFLITTISINKWNKLQFIQLNQFYLMRIGRILPCLILLITILSLLHFMGVTGFILQHTTLEQTLFSAFTFQINWLEAKTGYLPANWDVLWSLSVEEFFYLFFPVLCILFRKQKHLVLFMILLIFIGPFARTRFTDNDIWSDHSYLSCMDGIAIGCLAAIYANKIRLKRIRILMFVTGCLLFGLIFFCRKQVFDFGITTVGLNVTILEVGIAFIIIATYQMKFTWFNTIQWFGRNSYEIYLTHSFVVLFFSQVVYLATQSTASSAIQYLAIILCSGVLGHIVARYFSEPFNRYIRVKKSNREISYKNI